MAGIKGLLVAAITALAAAGGAEKIASPKIWLTYVKTNGLYESKVVTVEGGTLDTVAGVPRLAPAPQPAIDWTKAVIEWKQIRNPPVWKFNGPFLRSRTEEPVVIDETTGITRDVTSVGLNLGFLCEAGNDGQTALALTRHPANSKSGRR